MEEYALLVFIQIQLDYWLLVTFSFSVFDMDTHRKQPTQCHLKTKSYLWKVLYVSIIYNRNLDKPPKLYRGETRGINLLN